MANDRNIIPLSMLGLTLQDENMSYMLINVEIS